MKENDDIAAFLNTRYTKNLQHVLACCESIGETPTITNAIKNLIRLSECEAKRSELEHVYQHLGIEPPIQTGEMMQEMRGFIEKFVAELEKSPERLSHQTKRLIWVAENALKTTVEKEHSHDENCY